jgi:hypothetical protein
MVSQITNRRLQLRQLYGFDFPEDLFRFWEFVNRLAPLEPLTALAHTAGLHLVGPFDVLAGRFDGRTPPYPQHLHWRYADDPPEFFTVFAGGPAGLHHGYYLDDPAARSGCVASYYAHDVFELEAEGETLFDACRLELEQREANCEELAPTDPVRARTQEEIARVRAKLLGYATAERPEMGLQYVEKYTAVRPSRFGRVVAPTYEGMGIVVPPKTYRPLSLPDRKLWRALKKSAARTPIIEEGWSALREGYPGTALKLGKDLWALGERPREYAYDLLDAAYAALGRDVLQQVLAHHREHPRLPFVDLLHVEEG